MVEPLLSQLLLVEEHSDDLVRLLLVLNHASLRWRGARWRLTEWLRRTCNGFAEGELVEQFFVRVLLLTSDHCLIRESQCASLTHYLMEEGSVLVELGLWRWGTGR